MSDEIRFTVGGLAEAAGVTVRTVRYYVAEGLLRDPAVEGRHALYDEDHLNRIGLIQKLRMARIPLAAIREHLRNLTPLEVTDLLSQAASAAYEHRRAQLNAEAAEAGTGGSAAGHVARLLEIAERGGEAVTGWPGDPVEAARGERIAAPRESAPVPESWERYGIGEGLELHVRMPVSPEFRGRLDRLLAEARALFSPY
jgi:DNA-binding transcriptional MerR regulator